jgi:hypothetical protein
MPADTSAIITGLKSFIFISPESAITLRIDYAQNNEIRGERNSFAKKVNAMELSPHVTRRVVEALKTARV